MTGDFMVRLRFWKKPEQKPESTKPKLRPIVSEKVGAKAESPVEAAFKRAEHNLEQFRKSRHVEKSGAIVWDLGRVNLTKDLTAARLAVWELEGIKKVKGIFAVAELNKIISELQSLSRALDRAGNTVRKVETDEVIVEACAIAEDDARIKAIKKEYEERKKAAEMAGKKTEAKYWQDMATKLANKAVDVRGGWTMFKEHIGPGQR